MNVRQRRKLFAGTGLIAMLFGAFTVVAPATAGAAEGFKGLCDPGTQTCVIDEPMGKNPATHGVVTYSRTGDDITFNIDLAADDAPMTELQICMQVADSTDNPYTPTVANTCAGNQVDRVLEDHGPFTDPYSVTISLPDALVAGFQPGDDVFFALHINTSSGRTTYVVGSTGGTPEPTADLSVRKLVDPAPTGENQPTFQFTGPNGVQFPLTHDGTEPFANLSPGTYTITETDHADYDLDGVECFEVVGNEEVVFNMTAVAGGVQLTLADGDDVTCEFTNVPEPLEPEQSADLSIVKLVDPAPAGAAPSFSFTGPDGAFSLVHLGEKHFADLSPGTYTITETDHADYDLDGVECFEVVGNEEVVFNMTAVAGGVQLTLADGDDVTCEFTNVPEPVTVIPGGQTPTYSLDIEKRNDANGRGGFSDRETADDEGDDVEFQLTIRNTGTGALVVRSLTDAFDGGSIDLFDAEYELACEGMQDPLSVGSVLAAGSTTVCTFEVPDYAPEAGEELVNTVTIVTNVVSDSDTSTVETEEISVLPTPPVTPPTPPVTPGQPPVVTPPVVAPPVVAPPQVLPIQQAPAPQVKGAVVTRQLPRTGSETPGLAAAGAGLFAIGAAMVLSSRMRFRQVD